MLCKNVLVSAIHQHKSALGLHMSPPSGTSLPPPTPSHPSRLSQSSGFGFPEPYSKFLLVSILHMVMCISTFLHLSPWNLHSTCSGERRHPFFSLYFSQNGFNTKSYWPYFKIHPQVTCGLSSLFTTIISPLNYCINIWADPPL